MKGYLLIQNAYLPCVTDDGEEVYLDIGCSYNMSMWVCEDFKYIPKFVYPSILYEVEVDYADYKSRTDGIGFCYVEKFKIIKSIPPEIVDNYFEINKYKLLDSDNYLVRVNLATRKIFIDKLINDPNGDVRSAVAEQGYGLDILVNDPSWVVRATVAGRGYGLDKLIDDPDRNVRSIVASQGYGLDKLINDEDPHVRMEVADAGGLDHLKILIEDPDPCVRAIVAEKGYGLDRLVKDPDAIVRIEVATQGYGLDTLIHDQDNGVKISALNYILSVYRSYNDVEIKRYLSQILA